MPRMSGAAMIASALTSALWQWFGIVAAIVVFAIALHPEWLE
jgi:hypothetical protein